MVDYLYCELIFTSIWFVVAVVGLIVGRFITIREDRVAIYQVFLLVWPAVIFVLLVGGFAWVMFYPVKKMADLIMGVKK